METDWNRKSERVRVRAKTREMVQYVYLVLRLYNGIICLGKANASGVFALNIFRKGPCVGIIKHFIFDIIVQNSITHLMLFYWSVIFVCLTVWTADRIKMAVKYYNIASNNVLDIFKWWECGHMLSMQNHLHS